MEGVGHRRLASPGVETGAGTRTDAARRSRRRRITRRLLAVVGVTIFVTVFASIGLDAGAFAGFQRRSTDALQPGADADPSVVVVGIDRATISELEQPWPWPRDMIAELVSRIDAAGADALVVDITFAGEREGDAELLAALSGVDFAALAASFELDGTRDVTLLTARAATMPPPAYDSVGTIAHAEVFPDEADAVVRSLPLVLEDPDGEIRPGLSLAAYQWVRGAVGPVTIRPNGVQVGDVLVPTRDATSMQINYAGDLIDDPGSPNFVSAGEVLAGDLPPGSLDGAVVFLGVTDPTLGDHKLAPNAKGSGMPGVFVHANAFNTMLTGAHLYPSSDTSTLLWVAGLAAVTSAAVLFLPMAGAVGVVILLALTHLLFAFVRFDGGREPELVYTNLAIVVAFLLALSAKYLLETRHRRHVSRLFERYIPEQIARELVEEGHDLSLEGSAAEISVFFCDLRGFTAMSAGRTPEEVRDILNIYYREVDAVLMRHGATIMQFVGDEVFAIFGAPLPMDDHPARAMAAAIEVQEAASTIASALAEHGFPPVHYGIGVNCGDVITGHVGDAHRLQYTVIGDTVNVGSRFCSLARPGEVVCSDEIVERVGELPRLEEVGPVDLKGVERELILFRVLPPPDSPAAALPREERRTEKAVERPGT